MGTDQAKSEQI